MRPLVRRLLPRQIALKIWIKLINIQLSKEVISFEPFKFEILKNDKFEPKFETQIDFNIKSDEYQSYSTHEYLQLLFWSFLHLLNS